MSYSPLKPSIASRILTTTGGCAEATLGFHESLLQALVYQAFWNLFITETATLTQKSSVLMKKIRYTTHTKEAQPRKKHNIKPII